MSAIQGMEETARGSAGKSGSDRTFGFLWGQET